MQKSRELLFRITMGHGGHQYEIYDNGEIKGFGEGAIIFNRHSLLVHKAVEAEKRQRSAKTTESES